MQTEDLTKKGFHRLLEWASAVSLGGLAAFLFALKQVNPVLRFEFNIWTALVFTAATPTAWFMTRAVLRGASRTQCLSAEGRGSAAPPAARPYRLGLFILVLAAITIGSFLVALKDIPPAKRAEVAIGAGAALLFLACALYGFWRVVQFLEAQEQPEEEPRNQEQPKEKVGPPA